MSAHPQIDEKLRAARFLACQKAPYLRVALFSLRPVPRPGLGTFGVDKHWRLYYDPQKMDETEWGVEATAGVLLHEVAHLVREHFRRGEAVQDKVRWNVATDLEINDDLEKATVRMPPNSMLPQRFMLPVGLLAEQYYQKLDMQTMPLRAWEVHGPFGDWKSLDIPPSCGSGATGVAAPWELPDDGEGPSELEQKRIRMQVAREIRSIGNVPGGWRVWADATLSPPKVPWQRVLQSRLMGAIKKAPGAYDWTYARPSRRHSGHGKVILPGLYQPEVSVAVVLDTSGSMADPELGRRVLSEVEGICRAVRSRVEVLSCDTEVHARQIVTRAKEVRSIGGGGTDMVVGIREAERVQPKPVAIVCITDGETPWPHRPGSVPLIVCLVRRSVKPIPQWAQVVRAYE